MKFRKKPVVIDALQWTGDNWSKISDFVGKAIPIDGESLIIDTLEGTHRASKGNWIIRGVKGEYYSCAPDIFEATYEKVENQ